MRGNHSCFYGRITKVFPELSLNTHLMLASCHCTIKVTIDTEISKLILILSALY